MRLTEGPVCLAVGLILLAGCSPDFENGFCDSHADEHWQHSPQAATMQVTYQGNGLLAATVSIPLASLDDPAGDALATLQHARADDLLLVESTGACVSEPGKVEYIDQRLQAEYRFDCGAESKLKKVSVSLLDVLPYLEEVEVDFTTPVVTKRFLVHRRCSMALYNFDNTPGGLHDPG